MHTEVVSMETKSLVSEAKTWRDRARDLPSFPWKATEREKNNYLRVHRSVGEIYDSAAVAFLRTQNIPVPPARSVYHWESLFGDQFFNYWVKPEVKWDEDGYAFAFTRLVKKFSKMKHLKMADFDDVKMEILLSEKKDKSSGYPYFRRKGDVIDLDIAKAKAIATGRVAPPMAVAYYRTQVEKTRLVWGLPLSVIALEGRLMLPITQALRRYNTPYSFGCTTMGMSGLLNRISYCPIQFCLDWSKFDSTVPHRVIHSVFNIIKSWFDSVDETMFDVIVRYFCTCPILMPDLRVYKGRVRGIPSGSWFTQLVGSMCNLFLTEYISYCIGENIQDSVYLGDDSVLGMDRMPKLENWERVARDVGMNINRSKQRITHGTPHYLGHSWGGIWPVRPIEETIQRMCTSERYKFFNSKEELLQYRVSKIKAYLIDNPDSYELVLKYLKFLLNYVSVRHVRIDICAGNLTTSSPMKVGWAKAMPDKPEYILPGFKSTVAQQILRH